MLIPKTRKEIYQAYLSGDTHLELPKPVTRDEIILYNACINGAGTNPSWNDLTDKPFGENEDGTITTIDPKYLPAGVGGGGSGGGGVTVVNLTWNDSEGRFYSEKTRSEIKALVSEGKQVVYYDGHTYSTFIDGNGDAIMPSISKSASTTTYRVSCEYYVMVSVGAWDTKVTLKPIISAPKIIIGNKAYDLSVGDGGAVFATELTSSDLNS